MIEYFPVRGTLMNNKDLIRKGKQLFSSAESSELFSTFSKLYPMTSENIKDTYELFDLEDKDILTAYAV